MAARRRTNISEQDSDYDGAWKEVLRQHLREILVKYLPAIAAAIDWRHPPQWSDKELSRILRQRRRRPKSVDTLVKVRLLNGAEQWILLHLEIQSSREAGFEFRIFRYNSGLVWIYDQRVVTVVILADLDETWRPEEDIFRLGDFESRLRFPVCKLIDRLDSDWRDDHSLPVQVARAQIAALRTAGDPTGRYGAKWQLVRNLYDLGYNADEVREIFRLIDWMMCLPEDLSRKFEEDLVALEESLNMPYVTSVERIAEERGETKGGASVLLGQLRRICGAMPEDLRQRLYRLPLERLAELGEALLDFRSLDDLRAWLDAHEPSGAD
ncbi:MAG: DUF4351 domain-containing protein [Planctomycetota bacterium]